ncbi:exonuclease-like protein [Gottschalkia purinilytica]|uniref:Exonuclease-like protein n=1 Tax=Gottschalkia purinilytica TaxID=1503 RepID=A0A0L0WDJ5_GOTPU|nr:ribonuclease H-like domain-containing protein [Gottschalkia purinilytica]KNF09549.1 exonuclease-like protein [Gottschalkia purinilytica]
MLEIDCNIDEKLYIPNKLKELLHDKNICFLDIETTGLSSKYNKIILIGILYIKNNKQVIKQFFADSPKEEKLLLNSFVSFISDFDFVITYNGNTFDIPFINKRLVYNNINFNIDTSNTLDLLRIIRKNKVTLGLEDCKLKSVEKYLGIQREDTISGKESVDLYNKYKLNKNEDLRKIILKHNFDDILYLPKILKIYDHIESRDTICLKYVLNDKAIGLNIQENDIKFSNNLLSIKGSSNPLDGPSQIHYDDFHTLKWILKEGILNIDIKVNKGKLSNGNMCYYICTDDIPINTDHIDNKTYNIPDNIILLKENNNNIINNIEILVYEILNYTKTKHSNCIY